MFFKQLEFIFYGFQDKRDQREPKGTNTQNLASLFEVQFVCTCSFYTPVFKMGRIMVYQCPTVHLSVRPSVRPFHMSRSNLRTPWPIHFKFHRVIRIDVLTVCILYGEISNFHSRVMGLYLSNCRWFFVCRAVNWEPLGQFTSNFAQLLKLMVLRSVNFMVKFWIFIPELWDFIHQIVGDFSYVAQ